MSIKELFTYIYQKNIWESPETRSGRGSEKQVTKALIKQLPILFKKYNITGLIDVGCGEYNWMRKVKGLQSYVGIDVVDDIIANNTKKYGNKNKIFECGELQDFTQYLSDTKYQAIMFADIFVHLPFELIEQCINIIKNKNIKYMFITTFIDCEVNCDIELDYKGWRMLNMEKHPFLLKDPLELLQYNEPYISNRKIMKDKYLKLFKI